MPTVNSCELTSELTGCLAADDFDEVLARLPAFQRDVESRLASAASDGERETVLREALNWSGRWLAMAKSLRADLGTQFSSLQAESSYAGLDEGAHMFDSVG